MMGRDGSRIRVAVGQMRSGSDGKANRESILDLAGQASDAGADLVALPEYSTFLGPDSAFAEHAESLRTGPTVAALRDFTSKCTTSVLLGSMLERADDDAVFNTSVFVEGGEVRATYRKLHLFTSTLPGASASESDYVSAGNSLAIVPWQGWNIGLSICFDLRFPELYRELTALGANILSVPAAFTAFTGRDHWDVLLRARAIENQAFVIAPAQIGPFEGGESFGRSCIIDPWGTVLARVGDGDGTGIAVATLDMSRLSEVRSNLPALPSRRFRRAGLDDWPD